MGLLFSVERLASDLGTVLYKNSNIFIDKWSLVHVLFGILIMYYLVKSDAWFIKKLRKYSSYSILFFFLVTFEIYEFYIYGKPGSILASETSIDLFWDVVFGMLGGFLYKNYVKFI